METMVLHNLLLDNNSAGGHAKMLLQHQPITGKFLAFTGFQKSEKKFTKMRKIKNQI